MPTKYVKECLKAWFNYPENKVYCQVSTGSKGQPHIRTMDLYHITDEGNIVFLTETATKKWTDLQSSPNAAVCILSLDNGQIITEGLSVLKSSSDDPNTASYYWENHLEQYWRDFYLSRVPITDRSQAEIPSTFGVIIVKPHFWEILEIDKDDFLQSSRKQFHLKNGSWDINSVSPA